MVNIKDVTLDEVQALIVPISENDIQEKTLEALKSSKAFSGKEGDVFVLPIVKETVKYMIYVGIGNKEALTAEGLREAIAEGVKKAKAAKVTEVGIKLVVTDNICVGGNVKAITEAALLASYSFDEYKTKTEEEAPMKFYLVGVPAAKVERANEVLAASLKVAEGVIIARDLVNEPSNVLYPETLAEKAVEVGKAAGCEVEVFDEKQIEALGMKAFLAVGASSERKPKLIVMRYMGDADSKEVLGLVGKGLTYDTGGYSLKPTDSMKTMQSDMGGAAAVIGAMSAIAGNKVKTNVIAVVAACENVISGGSYKPGDIIGSMAGKTIEILNTDAEGRLTLADAITYAIEKEKVTRIIDLATLTGAALVALGTSTTAVVTNNQDFYEVLQAAAKKSGEQFWQLPAHKEYAKMNKSTVADLKNTGGRFAGTITAGLFVGEFVQDLPWLHLDIAGTAWADSAEGYITKGGTGAPVRTLYRLVEEPCGCHHNH